jgi:regulator of RNase E activity RraB
MADDESLRFEILSEGGTPEERDLEVLEHLEEHGADLSEPREVRVNLYFATEEQVEAAGEELTEAGYEVVAWESAGEEELIAVRATRELRLDRDNIAGFRAHFEDFAERHGGEFDGWEAAAD